MKKSNKQKADARAGYLFMIPWMLGTTAFVLIPLVVSLYLSFTDYAFTSNINWIGIENYFRLFFMDQSFTKSLEVTFKYVIGAVPGTLIFALLVAVLLNRGMRGLGVFRAIYYLPSLIGGSVAISMLWRQVFGAYGIVNQLLGKFGIEMPSWIGDPRYSLFTIIILHIWQFGAPMIIFLAGLKNIPSEYYEAASIDGAGKLRQFFAITLPLLSPTILFNFIQQLINGFKAFTPAYIVSGGTGGPARSLLFYTLSLYKNAFSNFQMGYASAQAWILMIIVAVFTLLSFTVSRRAVYYESKR